MKVTTKGRYGLRAMIDLATYPTKTHVPLNYIAERQNLSANYMEQIFSILKMADLVKSIKGAQGGYALAAHPSEITIGKILKALEGNLSVIEEEIYHGVKENSLQYFVKINVWDKITERANSILESITLEDMVNEYIEINQTNGHKKDFRI